MNQEITLNHQPYPIIATRRKGVRRFVLKFNAKRGEVRLTLPPRGSLKDALSFAHSKKVWLELQQEKLARKVELKPGMMVRILGQDVLLQHEEGRGLATFSNIPSPTEVPSPVGARLDIYVEGWGHDRTQSSRTPLPSNAVGVVPPLQGEGLLRSSSEAVAHNIYAVLTIHGDISFFNRRLKDWLRKYLKQEIEAMATPMAKHLGVAYSSIQIRDTVSQWGSCSASGTLSFSFALVFATREQLHYLIAHEVAHLVEMNHSPRFWKLVAEHCPDFQRHRKWFKAHGHELQRYVL